MSQEERPEALAQFAESARRGERAGVQGLTATQATAPIPTESKAKDEAAAKVLAEGATGQNQGSEEAIEHLPDRILDTQDKDNTPTRISDLSLSRDVSYNATLDPRTGRPPNPLEAQRIARENELQRLRSASDADSVDDDGSDFLEGLTDEDSLDQYQTQGFGDVVNKEKDRKASSRMTEDERQAVEDLVSEGLSREYAEGLVETHSSNRETLKAAAWAAANATDQSEDQ